MTDRVGLVRAEIKRLRKDVEDYIAELGNSESERIGLFKDLEIYDNILSFIDSMQKEPVSEDLEKAAKHHLYSCILYDDVYVGNPTDKDCIEMFKAGAKWQKQQDNNDANHALVEQIKTQQMCYEKGMADMKQQMMNGAVDGKIYETQARSKVKATTTGYVSHLDYKVGEKVKLLIIKEDRL